jgi:hypothetical protein
MGVQVEELLIDSLSNEIFLICNLHVIIFVTVDNNYEQNQFSRIKTS